MSSVVFQDRILDSLTNMQERISTLEAKGTTGPVLSQQPMQLHGQYGYTPPHQQLPYFQPPVSQYGTGQVTPMAPPQHLFGAGVNKFKTPSGVKPSASFTLGQVSGISDRSRYHYNSSFLFIRVTSLANTSAANASIVGDLATDAKPQDTSTPDRKKEKKRRGTTETDSASKTARRVTRSSKANESSSNVGKTDK